jgi:hypothetical protein
MVWRLHGAMGVVQFGGFDPSDPAHLFSKSMHYVMDWSKPAGQEATCKGYNYDPRTFPDDPRNHIACESTMARTIAGRRLLFKTNMWGSFLAVYRFDARHGEIAIRCGLIARDRLVKYPGEPSETLWPKDQPRETAWIWADKNGDGQIQKEELIATKSGSTWDIDANGDIWSASDKIYHHRFKGFDEHGTPMWDTASRNSLQPSASAAVSLPGRNWEPWAHSASRCPARCRSTMQAICMSAARVSPGPFRPRATPGTPRAGSSMSSSSAPRPTSTRHRTEPRS